MIKMFKGKKAQGWTVPSIFALTGIILLIGGFMELGFWWGALGMLFIILSIWLWIKQHG